MNTSSKQIFQTQNPTRWQRFKWATRFILFLLALAVVAVIITVGRIGKESVAIPLEGRAVRKVLKGDVPVFRQSKLAKQYRGMRNFIQAQWLKGKGCGQKNHVLNLSRNNLFNDSLGVRAAFYVTWDRQSYLSLTRNINRLNLILPEWFFIDPNADTLITKIDDDAYNLIKQSGIKVIPILSNANIYSGGSFNGKSLHRIFTNKAKRQRLINEIVTQLTVNHFNGINVDFEDLEEKNNETLTSFQKDLYIALHKKNLLVTQNVSPFNEDYNYRDLSDYNDYIFLMAYDEHSLDTKPGPISSQRWVEAAVDNLARDIPSSKIILNIAGYGYDWNTKDPKDDTTVKYNQALIRARENESTVKFDNDTYNVSYEYYDEFDNLHEVYFTDAATDFNLLRFATEYGLAGTALWRLGSEDDRMWNFYDLPMNKAALQRFDFSTFNDIASSDDVDYIGEGEILDILSAPAAGKIRTEINANEMLISEENYQQLPSTYIVRKWGKTSQKKLVLTFDDGPDPVYTSQILDTLAYYHVPATFFMIGFNIENNISLVKKIYREGYEIGNHTFTHPNIYAVKRKRALIELDATRLLIECVTGHSTIMFRAPFNADSDPEAKEELIPIELSRTRNYITVGESLDPNDWNKEFEPTMNGDTILNRIVRQYQDRLKQGDNSNIILLHDAGGDRTATVASLGKIIRYFKARGYQFTTVANLLGKTRDDLMPSVPKGTGYWLLQLNYFIAETGDIAGHFLTSLFIVFIVLSLIRIILLGIFAILERKKEKQLMAIAESDSPMVSIIVPAYNEQVNIVSSLTNLLKCTYPNFEIIFVDDGSKDDTYKAAKEVFENEPKIKLYTKPNGGKASALSYGIEHCSGGYVVCIDADTKLLPNAVSELMKNFSNENVGAVAGVVKVGNEINILTKWQSIEYISSQNFDREGFAYLNAITVIPGAIGAFSRKALNDAGGFTTDTLAEDCDLTIRLLRAGYIVANEPNAIALTEAPETVKQFMKQRLRWTFGVMQTFWKNKDALFNNRYKSLAWVAMPDMLLFKYIIPFFSPLADFIMALTLIAGSSESKIKMGKYYLVFLIVDTLIALIAFAYEKEKPWKIVWIIPQRLIYRWLMLIVLFRSFKRAIKGELQHWGVLKRTGNVKDIHTIPNLD